MMIVRHVEKLTKGRSLFKDKKRSGYLTFLNTAIYLGNRKGSSKASAR